MEPQFKVRQKREQRNQKTPRCIGRRKNQCKPKNKCLRREGNKKPQTRNQKSHRTNHKKSAMVEVLEKIEKQYQQHPLTKQGDESEHLGG